MLLASEAGSAFSPIPNDHSVPPKENAILADDWRLVAVCRIPRTLGGRSLGHRTTCLSCGRPHPLVILPDGSHSTASVQSRGAGGLHYLQLTRAGPALLDPVCGPTDSKP